MHSRKCSWLHQSYWFCVCQRYVWITVVVIIVRVSCSHVHINRESQNHQIAWVGRDLEDHVGPAPCHGFVATQIRLCRGPSSLAFSTSWRGAPITSLGSLWQCLSILWVKNFVIQLWAASTHCSFASSYLSTRMPNSFSTQVLFFS